MTIEQAATFFTSSILTMLAFVVICAGIVAINNILHKYWKPVQFFKWVDHPPARFLSDEEAARVPPHLNQETK